MGGWRRWPFCGLVEGAEGPHFWFSSEGLWRMSSSFDSWEQFSFYIFPRTAQIRQTLAGGRKSPLLVPATSLE